MRWMIRPLAVALLALGGVFPTSGQAVDTAVAEVVYPFDLTVESDFEAGVRAFERAAYDSALAAFQSVIAVSENRRTTAAVVMAGRTLVASERYGEAVGLLSGFLRQYPKSNYRDAASRTLELARQRYQLERERQAGVFELGVLLPMTDGAVRFTRSMFTGIRMAVDRYNERGARQVRLVFEDSGADPDKARAAFHRLLDRANPGAIIGPLFSEEAVAVADLADSAGVLLVVPLATDGTVAEEKTTVFQANPTYEMRGRMMARHAIQRLRHSRLGVIASADSYAARMAEAFEEEARELEVEVPLVAFLEELREWYLIAETFASVDGEAVVDPNNRLATLDAVYVPVTGGDAAGLASIAMDEINLVDPRLPILGNGEWEHVPEVELMIQHGLVFASDFRVDSTNSDVVEFDRQFRLRMSRSPDQPAFVGHDVTAFLLDRLQSIGQDGSLMEAFHDRGEFRGYGIRLYFGDGQVNQSLFFSRFTERGLRTD